MKNKDLSSSFKNAVEGIITTINDERNMRIHLCAAAVAMIAAVYLKVETFQLLMVMLAIVLVIGAELINTSIENVVNMITGGRLHPMAKKAKDAAAGAVLVASAFALAVGCLVFVPRIAEIIGRPI